MEVWLVFLGFLAAVCVHAQVPIPCESPKLWEGARLFMERSKHFGARARLSYDEANERTKSEDLLEEGRERELISVLRLFKTKKEYKWDMKTKKCNVSTIDFPFRPIGVPKEAKFLFEAEIGVAGLPNESVTVATFYGNATEDKVRYSTTVTVPDCVPIGDNYYNDVIGFVETRYFDIHLGLKDEHIFDIPPQCTSLE